MTREERVLYLSNVAQVAGADGKVSPREGEAIERVRKELGARKEELAEALRAVARGGHSIQAVGRFSDRVRNLEDMLLVAVCDGRFSGKEKPEVAAFAKEVGVSQAQLDRVLREAVQRVKAGASAAVCPSCSKPVPPESRFCPGCGADLRASPA